MKALTVEDLDALARDSVKNGRLANLALDLHIDPRCHPGSGMKTTRAYEGDNMMLACSVCNLFVCNLKIAKE